MLNVFRPPGISAAFYAETERKFRCIKYPNHIDYFQVYEYVRTTNTAVVSSVKTVPSLPVFFLG